MTLQNREAEQALIGASLLNPKALEDIAGQIAPPDFAYLEHGIIWQAIMAAWNSGLTPDVITVSEFLGDRAALDDVGGLAYLAELARDTPFATNAASYAGMVLDMAQRRRVLAAVDGVGEMLRDSQTPLVEAIQAAQQHMVAIHQPASEKAKPIGDHLHDMLDAIDRRWNGEEKPHGLTYGIKSLDEKTYGMQDGNLIIIAGRPSMGKSAFLCNVLEAACIQQGHPGVFFSMEMPAQQVTDRIAACASQIPINAIKDPKNNMHEDYFARLGIGITKLKDAPLILDDRSGLKPSQIRSSCIRWREHFGKLSWIAVDYLQLIQPDTKGTNREREVSEVSRFLKEIAKEMECPVIALSQLNRALESRIDKRPRMSDLRESGALEQDADVIIFLYRDEVYNENTQAKGVAEAIIDKQREGDRGCVYMNAILHHGKFTDISAEEQKRVKGLTELSTPKAAKSPYSQGD